MLPFRQTVGSKMCSMDYFRVRLKMPCAKFCVNWSKNVGGVGKRQFSCFRNLADKKLSTQMGVAYAKRCSRLQ